MNHPLISIIIPAYNAEQYLEKCLESVCMQTLKNIEIILVNDGSTDNTAILCDKWAAGDNRIRVIHSPNKGLAHVCNTGIEVAQGAFIGFVDSDDWIEPDMFETLYESICDMDSDIAVCGVYRILENGHFKKPHCVFDRKVWNRDKALLLLMMDHNMPSYRCNKLFKKDLFDGVVFPPNRVYEDIATIYRVFAKANRVSHSGSCSYYYLQREGSIANTFDVKKEMDCFNAYWERFQFIRQYVGFSNILKKQLSVFTMKALLRLYDRMNKLATNDCESEKQYMLQIIRSNYRKNYNAKWFRLHNIMLSLRKKPLKWFYR